MQSPTSGLRPDRGWTPDRCRRSHIYPEGFTGCHTAQTAGELHSFLMWDGVLRLLPVCWWLFLPCWNPQSRRRAVPRSSLQLLPHIARRGGRSLPAERLRLRARWRVRRNIRSARGSESRVGSTNAATGSATDTRIDLMSGNRPATMRAYLARADCESFECLRKLLRKASQKAVDSRDGQTPRSAVPLADSHYSHS